jgi:hypothetical protein
MDRSCINSSSMPSLHQTIAALASSFTQEVLVALRGVSMAELSEFTSTSAPSRGRVKKSASAKSAPATPARKAKAGRLARRSSKQIASLAGKLVAVLKGKKAGLGSEAIQKALGLTRKEMPRPIQEALAKKLIRRTGQRRATKYFEV